MNLLKKTYHLIAALALLNLVALGVGVGLLASRGMLTGEKVRAVVDALKAESAQAGADADSSGLPGSASTAGGAALAAPVEREIARLNLERVTRAAEDQLKYTSRMMVDIERRREEIQRQKEELENAQVAAQSAAADESFQKELEVLSLLKPKIALDNLLALDLDSAARFLGSMESRTAKKIVEAASKDPLKWAQVLQIQEKMRMPAVEETAQANAASAAPTAQP